jgi:hypothetical protein
MWTPVSSNSQSSNSWSDGIASPRLHQWRNADERLAPQVVAVEPAEVEGVQNHAAFVAPSFDLSQGVLNARCYAAMEPKRSKVEARRIARLAYPYPRCCLCGQSVGVECRYRMPIHSANNEPDNLAWLCRHHLTLWPLSHIQWRSCGPTVAFTCRRAKIASTIGKSVAYVGTVRVVANS